jgi:non-ribosomal peptide synthetase component F
LGHYVQSLSAAIGLKETDRYLHTASISFSSSVRQLMLPLAKGAAIVMASGEEIGNPLSLLEMAKEKEVTVVDFVPSYWRNLLYALDNATEEKANSLLDNKLRFRMFFAGCRQNLSPM